MSAAKGVAGSLRERLPRALLILTFTTGLLDAVSFLGLGRVFTANMTGNVVFLGFGIAGAGGLPVLSPIVSMAAFLLGAGAGGALASKSPDRRSALLRAALVIEVALIAIAAGVALVVDVHSNQVSGDAVVALLALAMGVRNATVRRLGVPDLTTTVLTMTLTGLAADSPLAHGAGKGSARRIAAVAAMFAGALVGALMVKSGLVLPLLVAAALGLLARFAFVRGD